ncbi:copper transport protein ctr1 [Actinomortierella ambigua]|uniref:Copper transport protein ctr1 n=1 Tax=Actinomortierella ambigua TaxID=1343610 RepID=A0A9P6QCU3_9FUNG|nr:copper transport protein ctr1 [Actinomortierella ambigua]
MSLILGKVVGQGGYGTVHFGRWQGQACAVKQVLLSESEYQHVAIQREIQLLQQLRHRHIIQFYKSFHHEGQLVIIMDFAEGGSLRHVIEETNNYNSTGSGNKTISEDDLNYTGGSRWAMRLQGWEDRTRIYQEIARGLAYMHSENILHRDLKSANVLMTRHLEVRLCDFGLATVKTTSASKSFADDTAVGGGLKGTLRWMAPEVLDLRPAYSTKSDIYALGMVMWEMAANCTTPFKDQPNQHVVMASVVNGKREMVPDHTPADYRRWIERCWEQDPAFRPDAKEMVGHVSEPEADFADLEYHGSTVDVTSGMISRLSITQPPAFDDELLLPTTKVASPPPSSTLAGDTIQQPTILSIPSDFSNESSKSWGSLSNNSPSTSWAAPTLPEQSSRLPASPPFIPKRPTATKDQDPGGRKGGRDESKIDKGQRTDPKLVLGSRIGSGIFGEVFKGKWARQICAIKKFRRTYAQDREASILHEIGIMERLRHRHIIQFYGTSHHKGSMVIIYELAEGGSLQDALRSPIFFPDTAGAAASQAGAGGGGTTGVAVGDWSTKERLAQEIALGLAYIHDQGVIHRNLRSRNVMLTKDGRAKLTSFALALEIPPTAVKEGGYGYALPHEKGVAGSPRWMAPELLTGGAPIRYSFKSDMYSFGMVLWELSANSCFPFAHLHDEESVFAHVRVGGREHIPDHTPQAFCKWIERCFDSDPTNRPTVEDILDEANELL